MLRKVRRGVFETNSSSCHSLAMGGPADGNREGFTPGQPVTVPFGEYGWQREEYPTPLGKLSYVLTAVQYLVPEPRAFYCGDDGWFPGEARLLEMLEADAHYRWLREMVADYTGATLVPGFLEGSFPMGSIDHQSQKMLLDYWSDDEGQFKSSMRDIVFGSAVITTDNDNRR